MRKSQFSIESILFIAALLAMSFFGFVARYVPMVGNLVDLTMMVFSLIAVASLIKNQYRIKREEQLLIAIVGAFTLALIVSLVLKHRLNGIAQYALYIGYLVPLLLWHRITPRMAYTIFLPLLIFIGVLQYPFDVIFPRLDKHVLDTYSGTFSIANNKSRFLFMVILAAAISYRRSLVFNRIVLPCSLILMVLSFLLGDSLFVYAFGLAAIFFGFHHKKKWLALVISGIAICVVIYIFQTQEDIPIVMFTYHRYFDPEHGSWAVIVTAFKIVYDTYGFGGGLGEFISRVSQTMEGEYLSLVPRTMVTFGMIYEDVIAPDGVPSYVSIIAETGIFGFVISSLLLVFLYRNSHPSFLGYALFIYVVFFSLYMPMFFEGPDGMIILYSYLFISRALFYRNAVQPIRNAAY